jgi:hypothetical protein
MDMLRKLIEEHQNTSFSELNLPSVIGYDGRLCEELNRELLLSLLSYDPCNTPKMNDNKKHNILAYKTGHGCEENQTLGFELKINNKHFLELITNFITHVQLRREIIARLKTCDEMSRAAVDYFVIHYYVIQSIQNGISAPYPATSKCVLVALLLSLLVDSLCPKNIPSIIKTGLRYANAKEQRMNNLSQSLVQTHSLLDCTVNVAHKNNSIKMIHDQILMYTDRFTGG